jgi:hypothetical protein
MNQKVTVKIPKRLVEKSRHIVLKLEGEKEKLPPVKGVCPYIHTCTELMSERDFDTVCLHGDQAVKKCISYAYLSDNKLLQDAWKRKLLKETGNMEMHTAKDWAKQYLL